MLQVVIPSVEFWDERNEIFINSESETLQLEHSLLSLSKWESKWCKPFLGKELKTNEEINDYIRCMTINDNVSPDVYNAIPDVVFDQINNYIQASMTATWFNENAGTKKNSRDIITAEIIYYWMISQNIPMECQTWHLNRLIALLRVCSIKNTPPKKMGKNEMLTQRQALNQARREQFNMKG